MALRIREREDPDRAEVERFLDERYLDPLRFYQRRGFRLAELHAGAVDDSRARLKPEIPRAGSFGIDLRDELVLKKDLGR